MTLRLGLRYDPLAPDGARAGDAAARLHREIVAHVRAAEARGADLVWLSERPFSAGAPLPAAFPLAAAIAAATTRVRIGVGPLALALHHPLRVAEDAASVDGLSSGRLELGLGLGANERAFDAFAVATAERVARFEEGVRLLRAAFADSPIGESGRFCDARGLDVHPKPVQEGARRSGSLRTAPPQRPAPVVSPTAFLCRAPSFLAIFAAAWAEAGRPPETLRASLELPVQGALERVCEAEAELDAIPALDLVLPALPPGATPDACLDRLDTLAAKLPRALAARRRPASV